MPPTDAAIAVDAVLTVCVKAGVFTFVAFGIVEAVKEVRRARRVRALRRRLQAAGLLPAARAPRDRHRTRARVPVLCDLSAGDARLDDAGRVDAQRNAFLAALERDGLTVNEHYVIERR